MSVQDLGLPPRFEDAMKGRLGGSGIFVDVGGKYYLNEARLQEFEQQRTTSGAAMGEERQQFRRNMLTLRMARMTVGIVAIALVVANILFVRSLDVSFLVAALFVLWIALTAAQLSQVSRARRKLTQT